MHSFYIHLSDTVYNNRKTKKRERREQHREEWCVQSLTLASSYLILLFQKACSVILTWFSMSEGKPALPTIVQHCWCEAN